MPTATPVEVGDVFAVRVRNGLYGLCHVVRAEPPRGKWDRAGRWTVVTCTWTGPRTGIAAALRHPKSLAPMKGRGFGGRLDAQSIAGSPPPALRKVGSMTPSASARRLGKLPVGAWQWIAPKIEDGLDPEATERRRERVRAAAAKRLAAARAEEKVRREAMRKIRSLAITADGSALRALARTPPLAAWSKHHPRAFVASVRKALGSLARRLAALGASTHAPVLNELASTSRALDVHHRTLTTPDAEELHEALVAIAVAAGCNAALAAHQVDAVRRW